MLRGWPSERVTVMEVVPTCVNRVGDIVITLPERLAKATGASTIVTAFPSRSE